MNSGPGRVIQGSFPNGVMQAWHRLQSRQPIQPKLASPRGPIVPPAMQRFARGMAIQLSERFAPPPMPGRPLPPRVLQQMESLFGTRFADVRVHVGPHVTSIGARAYTEGRNIHFAPGAYAPETPQGRQLLAHELAHVVQQRSGRVSNPFGRGTAIVGYDLLEMEANRIADRARMAPQMAVQRQTAARAIDARIANLQRMAVIQRMITYTAKTKKFDANRKRPGWFGWLKALWYGMKGDIAHIVSFKLIQDTVLTACKDGDADPIRRLADEIADDAGVIDKQCDKLEAATGDKRKDIANQILSTLNSSSKNTRKGKASVNRRIKQYLDPVVESSGKGKFRFSDDSRSILENIDDQRDEFESYTDDPRSLSLRRTHSGNRLFTSDFNDPVEIGKLSPRSKAVTNSFPWDPLTAK